eukprot:111033-Hanusia_phi.AAC.2
MMPDRTVTESRCFRSFEFRSSVSLRLSLVPARNGAPSSSRLAAGPGRGPCQGARGRGARDHPGPRLVRRAMRIADSELGTLS